MYKMHKADALNYQLVYQPDGAEGASTRLGYISTATKDPKRVAMKLIYEHLLFRELPLVRERCHQRAAEIAAALDRPAGGAS